MAVSSDVARVVHTANGVATFFSFAPIDGATSTNLKVYLFDPTTGVLTLQTLGTDYTFGGGGVTFTTAPPNGRRVILFRQVELLQPDIYKTNAPFPAVVTEKRFDEIVKGLQQINDIVQNRAIIMPLGDAGFSNNTLPAVENRKGTVLYFNDTTGDPEAKQLADTVVAAPPWAVMFLSQTTAAAGLANIGAVAKAGDTMTGPLTLSGAPTAALHAATKDYVDTEIGTRVDKTGDTMTGPLTLSGAPTAALHAATKSYVDTRINTRVAKTGDTMTGFLTLNADPTSPMHAATKQYVDNVSLPSNFVLRAGDTMTGDLSIFKPIPILHINSPTVTNRALVFSTNGSQRWHLYTGDDTESGGNAGSTFRLLRFSDAGAPLGDIFVVDRATGRLTFSGSVLPRVPAIDPTDDNDVVRKAYADRSGPGGSTGLIATTSGSAYDVTGIPSWANVVEVLFIGVTTSASVRQCVRLGTSSGFVTSGYQSGTGSRTGEVNDSTCFVSFLSGQPVYGIMRIVRAGGNTWLQSHAGSEANFLFAGGGGRVNIGDVLTQIRVFISGANYVGGHIAVRWTA